MVLRKTLPGTSVPVGAGNSSLIHDAEGQAYEAEFLMVNATRLIDVCTVVGDEHLELKTAFREQNETVP